MHDFRSGLHSLDAVVQMGCVNLGWLVCGLVFPDVVGRFENEVNDGNFFSQTLAIHLIFAYLCSRFRNLWQDMQPANIAISVNIFNIRIEKWI